MKNVQTATPPWMSPQWQCSKSTTIPLELVFGPWSASQVQILQEAKHRIAPLESSNRWELLKKMVNPYEMVYTHEDPHFHPSIAIIKPLSRSYFKLIEILDVLQFYERLPKQNPKIRTAHIAEGPGGFIQAVADLTERHKKTLYQATTMTLRPTNNCVPGWKRAFNFLQNHREVRLHYGEDNTGDVYVEKNQDSFVKAVAPNVHLFTADGGFDFSINYDIQEECVYRLLVCSAMVGLRCLVVGGTFVLKLFDIYSDSTKILVCLMGRCFKEWTLYKPSLSRPCNSERYFLGRDFKGFSPTILSAMNAIQQKCKIKLYPVNTANILTKEEQLFIEENVNVTTKQQLAAIFLAEQYAEHPEIWYSTQLQRDFQTSLQWCQRFRIPFTLTKPISVPPVLYISGPSVGLQSPLPGDGSTDSPPSDQVVPTLSEELKDQTRIQ